MKTRNFVTMPGLGNSVCKAVAGGSSWAVRFHNINKIKDMIVFPVVLADVCAWEVACDGI
jgi:hypothetical protein